MEDRSYSLLTIKSVDEKSREISGIMSTPETDRVGDQVVSTGMKARLPAPCLWQHDHGDPIGEIVWVEARPDGIKFRAKLAQVESPASLKEKFDSYFELIRRGLVKGISIGFRPLEMEPIATGWLIKTWELLEASVVTIPANASCNIQSVKAYSKRQRDGLTPAMGRSASSTRSPVVKLDAVSKARLDGTLKIHTRPKWKPGDPIRIPKSGTSVVKLDKADCPWLNEKKGPARVVRLSAEDGERGRRRASAVVVKMGRR